MASEEEGSSRDAKLEIHDNARRAIEGPLGGEEVDVEVNEKGEEGEEELELKLKRDGWNRTLGVRAKDDLHE